jgi:hypothetical protein
MLDETANGLTAGLPKRARRALILLTIAALGQAHGTIIFVE